MFLLIGLHLEAQDQNREWRLRYLMEKRSGTIGCTIIDYSAVLGWGFKVQASGFKFEVFVVCPACSAAALCTICLHLQLRGSAGSSRVWIDLTPCHSQAHKVAKNRIRLWGKSLGPVNPLAWQGCAAAVSVRRSRMRPLQGPLARPEQSSGGFEAHGVGFRV